MSYEQIQVLRSGEGEGEVAELVLNRPDRRNAMSPEMGKEIERAVAELSGVAGLRAVIVRGAGASFSAGGDFDLLEGRARAPEDENRRAMRAFYGSYLSILDLPVPTIAALHGHAIGAGLCFALACDLRIAAEKTQLGMTFTRVGLHPGMGATFLLPRAIGHARAAELLLTGRVFDAAHARDIGLVSEVVPEGEVLAKAQRLAAEIGACAPVAVSQLADTLRRGPARSLEDALDREALCQAVDYATEDLAEAIAAFRQKRKPVFSGK